MQTNETVNDLLSARGKIWMLFLKGEFKTHVVIQDCSFSRDGGRLFLIGSIPPGVVTGFDGVIVGVAWDEVQEFYTFCDLDQYFQARDAYTSDTEEVPKSPFEKMLRTLLKK